MTLTLRRAEFDIACRLLDRKPRGWHKLHLLRHHCDDLHDPWTCIEALNTLTENGVITYSHGWYRANEITGEIIGRDRI
jgi:hypothetical protein